MSADTAALLACPFCGSTDAVRLDDGDSWDFLPDGEPLTWAVVCDYNRGGCGGSGGFRDSQKDAIAAWNQAAVRLAELEAELARLQEDKARLEQVQSDVLANLDAAPDDMDVISAAHFVAGSLSTAEEALEAAHAEARELRAELARMRELAAKWRAAPQNPDEPLLAMAADELEAALSQTAEQHDPLAVSDHCPECSEPEPECVCGEQPDDREHLARHGYRPTPAAQESGDA